MNLLLNILSFFLRKDKPTKPIGHVAICVGHSRIGDYGADTVDGISEWDFNVNVADVLKDALESRNIKALVVNKYPRKTYGQAMEWLAAMLQPYKFDCAIELHFNSASPQAHGYEYLHLSGSGKGQRLANCLLEAHMSVIGNKQKSRGTTAIKAGDRGYGFLSKVAPPAVICEPFFGSNRADWKLFDHKWGMLADIYATGIENFLKS